MEKRLKRIEIILIGLTVLTVVSLALQLTSNSFIGADNTTEDLVEKKALPDDVTRDFTNKVVYRIKTDFNKEDWTSLYEVFGEYAKVIIEPDQIKSEFSKLINAIGKIRTYTYSHYKYLGFEDDADWFKVYYKCRFDNGRGIIELQIRSVEGKSEITGVNINLEEL